MVKKQMEEEIIIRIEVIDKNSQIIHILYRDSLHHPDLNFPADPEAVQYLITVYKKVPEKSIKNV